MRFWWGLDEFAGTRHKYIVSSMEKEQFQRLKELWEKQIPVISGSVMIRRGHPIISIDFGVDFFRSAIPLDDLFESGERLGDKLVAGDILIIVLTDQPEDEVIASSKSRLHLNVPLEDILVFGLRYTEEMSEIYTFFRRVHRPDSSRSKRAASRGSDQNPGSISSIGGYDGQEGHRCRSARLRVWTYDY